MSGFFNNVKDFCAGFESILPVGKVTAFVVTKTVGYIGNQIVNDVCPKAPDFFGYTASVDRSGYNAVMNRRDHFRD
jgi:hypothetical protein